MSGDLKAYSCMETYEYSGAIFFAKSNIEARKASSNEFNDGQLGGMTVSRAPWADKYGARHKIPISEMIEHGWHFECFWSGVTIDSDLYTCGYDFYNRATKEYDTDTSFIGKEPVGFQEGPCFACQEYADLWYEYKRNEKEFNNEQLEYFKSIIMKSFPDAVIEDDGEEGYGRRNYVTSLDMKTSVFQGIGPRYVSGVHVSFDFPGRKHWAALEFGEPKYGVYGPRRPEFVCANGDVEVFTAWAKDQKEKYNL